MQLSPFPGRFALIVLGVSLFTLAPLRADDDIHATVEQIHGLLHRALEGDNGTPPPNAQRAALLTQAQDLIDGLVLNTRAARHARAMALADVKSALEKVNAGDVSDTAKEDIRDADSEVRDLE